MAVSTYDLTTVDAVREYMGGIQVAPIASNSLLQTLITAVSRECGTYCSRDFRLLDRTELYSGTGSAGLVLNNGPIVSVSACTNGTTAVQAAGAAYSQGYIIDGDFHLLIRGCGWSTGVKNVSISYLAGYLTPGQALSMSPQDLSLVTVPEDLQQSVIETVSLRFKRIAEMDKNSVSIADQSVSFINKSIAPTAQVVWDAYKRAMLW